MKGYFGVYWTFPVPWAGFTSFESVEQAARDSRTIRYQRDRVRREVAALNGILDAEAAFMEQAPDRGTHEVADEIARTVRKRPDLTPVLVDFSTVLGWRRHYILKHRMEEARAHVLTPDPVMIDGQLFDPAIHFRMWAAEWATHAMAKPAHRALILTAVAALPEATSAMQAAHLNASGLRTHTGREWTADNLRKFLKG